MITKMSTRSHRIAKIAFGSIQVLMYLVLGILFIGISNLAKDGTVLQAGLLLVSIVIFSVVANAVECYLEGLLGI